MPYDYGHTRDLMKASVDGFNALSGDELGESGISWQEIADATACNLRRLAAQLDDARRGGGGPITFPSLREIVGNTPPISAAESHV